MSRAPDAEKSGGAFRACAPVARAQQAKSWELRAAMSLARLWRDQGKREQAPRSSRADLPAGFNRRLRHARLEGGQGALGGAARLTINFETAS